RADGDTPERPPHLHRRRGAQPTRLRIHDRGDQRDLRRLSQPTMMTLTSSLRIHDLDEDHDVLRTVLGQVPGAQQVATRIRGDEGGTVFDVFAFTGEEGIGHLYHFDLDITVEDGDLELE